MVNVLANQISKTVSSCIVCGYAINPVSFGLLQLSDCKNKE